MKKIIPILIIPVFVSFQLSGQTIPEKLDKLKNNSKTKQDAAKADSFIINKKTIFSDSTKGIKRKERECKRTSKSKSGQQ